MNISNKGTYILLCGEGPFYTNHHHRGTNLQGAASLCSEPSLSIFLNSSSICSCLSLCLSVYLYQSLCSVSQSFTLWLSAYLSIFISFSICVSLYLYQAVCLSFTLFAYLSIFINPCVFVYIQRLYLSLFSLNICLSLSVCLSTYMQPSISRPLLFNYLS